MPTTLITPPSAEPVTLAQFKQHARVTRDDEDGLITGYLVAARRYCETALKRQLITATWRLTLDRFPCNEIVVPRPPLVSVPATVGGSPAGIRYLDSQAAWQTLSSAAYSVDAVSQPGRIVPAYGYSWPDTLCQANAVEVYFTAGYGAVPSDVPMTIRAAIQLLAAHWYEHREAAIDGPAPVQLPLAVEALLASESHGAYSA